MRIATDGSAQLLPDGRWLATWATVPFSAAGRPLTEPTVTSAWGMNATEAELAAVIAAVDAAPDGASLTIASDCASVVEVLGRLDVYARRDWRRADGRKMKYATTYAQLHLTLRARRGRVRFEWVRGHDRHLGNRACDLAARARLRSLRDQPQLVGA